MAYKINKNRKGHYAMMRTDSPAAAVQEMERLMRLHEDVMRVMTIKVDAHKRAHPFKCKNVMTAANAVSAARKERMLTNGK